MPLTKSQVQLAFKRARAHFRGRIPKGTKLARFLPHGRSRRSVPRNSPPGRRKGSSIRTKIGSAARRVRHTAKSKSPRKMSMITKGLHILYTAIAAAPRIEDAKALAEGSISGTTFTERILEDYTGFDVAGGFSVKRLARGYGPVAGAYALSKVIGFARRHWRF